MLRRASAAPMMTMVVLMLATAMLAGCLAEAPPAALGPEPIEPGTVLPVPQGTWQMLSKEGPGFYGLDLDIQFANIRGIWTQDSVACAGAALQDGWLGAGASWPIAAHRGTFIGAQSDAGTTWSSTNWWVRTSSDGGIALGMDAMVPPVILFHDQVGPGLDSVAEALAEGPMMRMESGRAWCLDGPSRFQGDYEVSANHLTAGALWWGEQMEQGILARLDIADAATAVWHGPSGSYERPESLEGLPGVTFCMGEPGPWRLELQGLAVAGSWTLAATVLDIDEMARCDGWVRDWSSPSVQGASFAKRGQSSLEPSPKGLPASPRSNCFTPPLGASWCNG
ncbi:MAG: hypothetical protein ACPGQL_10220 [Thermoplasmatota archaeon]